LNILLLSIINQNYDKLQMSLFGEGERHRKGAKATFLRK